jgi:branched-chain amino acid transport system permease protein
MSVLQQVIDGISTGSIYASLALALILVYRSTGMVNFAQGQMAVVSAYVAWSLNSVGVPVGFAVALAVAASFFLGAGIERGVMRRFEGGDLLTAVIATVAVLICTNGLVSLIWGSDLKPFPAIFPHSVVSLAGARVTVAALCTIAILLLVVIVLQLLFMRTRLGLALRSVADNPESSALCGLPVGHLLTVGWGLAAMVGGLAACLVAPQISLQPDMMETVLVYALAAAILGGLDSPLGAIVTAWGIGIVQNLAGAYVGFIGSDLQIIVPLALMVAILLVRPQGLFGRRQVQRV